VLCIAISQSMQVSLFIPCAATCRVFAGSVPQMCVLLLLQIAEEPALPVHCLLIRLGCMLCVVHDPQHATWPALCMCFLLL
jgi:hypothetical protein